MTLETISGSEWVIDDEIPTIQGDYIENILVLGRESKNAWNATVNTPGDPKGPRRKFNVLLAAAEEVAKFGDRPANILHKPLPRDDADKIGEFDRPAVSPKGLRMRMLCRKLKNAAGVESYHPQAAALRDNIEHRRPFGGFSPRFDFQIDPTTGEVQTIVAVESIDLVPMPASVRSALEDQTVEPPVTKEQFASLSARLAAAEAIIAKSQEARTVPLPDPQKPAATPATGNFRDFIRS